MAIFFHKGYSSRKDGGQSKSKNYTVRFKKTGHEHNFGFIKKFYDINGKCFVLLQKLRRSSSNILVDSLEVMNKLHDKIFFEKLNNFFSIRKLTDEFEIIDSNNITSKCILIEKGLFFISPYVNIHS